MLNIKPRRIESLTKLRQGNTADVVYTGLAYLFGITILATTGLIIFQLLFQGLPALEEFGLEFFTRSVWDPVEQVFGALPSIQGTLVTALLAMVVAGPIGVGIAAFLVEIASPRVDRVVGILVEMLAAIPSVVYGLWGIFVLAPFLKNWVEPWLIPILGWIPGFAGPMRGYSVFTASMVLMVMILPTVAAISRNVFLAVPNQQREAMLALGATRWEMFRGAVFPYARAGVIGALALALGRAAGETMAVTIIIGNARRIFESVFDQGVTMASIIAANFTDASGELYRPALFLIGASLFGITFIVNLSARLLIRAAVRAPTSEKQL